MTDRMLRLDSDPKCRRDALRLIAGTGMATLLASCGGSGSNNASGSVEVVNGSPSPTPTPAPAAVFRPSTAPTSIPLPYEVTHVLLYGQSLPGGYRSVPLASTGYANYSLKMGDSVRTPEDLPRTTLTYLNENVSGEYGETPASGFAAMFAQLCMQRLGIDLLQSGADAPRKLLFTDPAAPASSVAALSGPGGPFRALQLDIQAAQALSKAANVTYGLSSLVWWQGQSDQGGTSQTSYETQVQVLRQSVESQFPTAGRSLDMLLVQIGTLGGRTINGSVRPDIALGHLDLVRTDPNIGGSFAEHWLPYRSADIHYPARSMRIAGAYLCLDWWSWHVDRVKPRPVAPARNTDGSSRTTIQGQTAIIPFELPSGTALKLDTSRFPSLPFGGILVTDRSGNNVKITSVEVRGTDHLAVTASGLKSGYTVSGGWTGSTLYQQLALRDSSGDTIIFDPGGTAHPMHKPAWIFEEILA